MSAPATADEFLQLARKGGVLPETRFAELFPAGQELPTDPHQCAAVLIRAGLLTGFQAKQLLAGRSRGFVLGPYKILQPLGQGGMGVVYLAEHTALGRKVALKVLAADRAGDRLTLERFMREARSAAALDHPNIVRLHDVSQGGGVHFLVMEYVDGTDLQSLMAKTGPLHYAQAAQYVAQGAAGLAHAHAKGFVHRDVKPANLILSKAGVVKLLDMGLARSFVDAADDLTASLGEHGEVSGTADYISPEQALGRPVDERSDVYSLGATLYALVTGHPPFKGTTVQKLMQHQVADPPDLGKLRAVVPVALAEVIYKMLAKKPAERYQTAEDVIDALGPWMPAPSTGSVVRDPLSTGDFRTAGTTAPLSPTSRVRLVAPHAEHEEEARPRRGNKLPWIAGGVAVAGLAVVLAGVTLWLTLGGTTAPIPAPNPQGTRPVARAAVPPYRLDLADQKPFARSGGPKRTGDLAEDTRLDERARSGDGEFPAGWRATPWDLTGESEFFAELKEGRMALGMRNLAGASAMLFTPRQATPERAAVRFVYRTDPGGTGYRLKFKPTAPNPQQKAWVVLGSDALPGTDGEWRTKELTVPLEGVTEGFFEFHDGDPDSNRAFYLAEFEVRAAGG